MGAGGFAKLANQIIVAAHLAAMGEAPVFGAKAGPDLDKLVGALSGGMANSAVLEGKAVNVHLKDLTYVRQAMDALDISLPLSELLRDLYQQAVDAGLVREDHSAIVRLFERSAGVEARR